MRRLLKTMFSLISLCTMFVCCSNHSQSIIINKAEVLDILEDRLLVLPYDTLTNEPIYFLISSNTNIDNNIKNGDFISALIDTKIMMSYPGQVNAFEVKIIKSEK